MSNNSQTDTFLTALYLLNKGGYTLYTSNVPSEQNLVIEDCRGVLSKVLMRRASKTETSPILTLTPYQQTETYLNCFGYLLAVEPSTPTVWLIPISDLPKHTKSLRLGSQWASCVVTEQQEINEITSKVIQQELKTRLNTSNKQIQQEDLEYLLNEYG